MSGGLNTTERPLLLHPGAQEVVCRVGIPLTGGALVRHAREMNYPTLFSANAFATVYPKGHEREGFFRGFRRPDPEVFGDMDAALDSAGFVAAARYGDYRWTVSDYMELAGSHPWAFYASMDYCCEPEVSGDRLLRMLRMAATAQLLGRCNAEARARGIPAPMPVLQGYTASEYLQCAEWLPLAEWPELVGIGSVCRRQLHGEAGIIPIVQSLDAVLPKHVRFHLFGVKSGTLREIGAHPRIASMDSMAWDFGARMQRRTGRDMAFRTHCMDTWTASQRRVTHELRTAHRRGQGSFVAAQASTLNGDLFDTTRLGIDSDAKRLALEALAMSYVELLLDNQVEYAQAVGMARRDAYPVMAIVSQSGNRLDAATVDHIEDVVPGFATGLDALIA